MSPDTNNNVGNDRADQNDEDDDQPLFKFSPITFSSGFRRNNEKSKAMLAEFSCIAVHQKFIVIGKTTGEIIITDHLGTMMPQYQINAHTYPVNAISIDEQGEYIGSCCQEGIVKISGLMSKSDDQMVSFSRPVKAICLDPNFSKTKTFITGDTVLVLNEKGRFSRHKKTEIIDGRGGLIHALLWKGAMLAFANEKGVGIFDLHDRRLVGFIETVGAEEYPRGMYPSRISWNNATTLAVARAKSIKIFSITESNNGNPSVAPRKQIDIVMSLTIQFFACGLTSVNHDLVLLGVEDFNITSGISEPSLTVLKLEGKNYKEKGQDPFSMFGDDKTSPFQFQLEYLPDEQCFFILCPYDIVKAEPCDYDDHIDFLIEKKKFDAAIETFEETKKSVNKSKRHTQQSVYRAYIKSLMDANETEKAVNLFSRVYTTAPEWEEQINTFIERNQLEMITPYIPIGTLRLSGSTYENVLTTYLKQKKYDKLKELLTQWPADICNLSSIGHQIRLATDERKPTHALLECSAIIAEKQGNVTTTLDIYLKMKNAQVFQLIERKKLHATILPHLDKLMAINENMTIELLVNNMDQLSVRSVHNALQKTPRYLHAYLDAVFSRNSNDCRDFHTLQVTLYSEYDPQKLMGFLRKAGNYNLQDALAICNEKHLHRELVFLYGRAGNGRVALQIILEKLNDIEEAIRFCQETGDQTLWTILINASVNKPEFIRGLLNHAGSDVNLQALIDQIRTDLRIPGLRDSLCKIMQDYNIQMSLSQSCRKIIVHDCLGLRKKTVTLLQKGFPVKDSDICAKCHNPVYSSDLSVSVFFCLHIFHAKCIETNPDICGVCSANTTFA